MVSEDVIKTAIDAQIHVIRGLSVILDIDLAALYQVTPGALLQAVRRNRNRFPPDFLFQLTIQEFARLKSQAVISNAPGRGGFWSGTASLRAYLTSMLMRSVP